MPTTERYTNSAFAGTSCIVTGGCGFIGSNLTGSLLASGARVTVIDNLVTGRLEHLPSSPNLTILQSDINQIPDLESLVSGKDYVFHLAAQVGNVKSLEQTEQDAATNVLGSVHVYRACRNAGIRKLVYASSSAIFGEAETIPIAEDHPQRPASFYALSKQTAEQYALLAQSLWGLPAVCTRFFNVYGLPMEKSEYSGVINIFMERLEQRRPLVIYGDGEQIRDFVYVKDVVQAVMLAAEKSAPGEVYNIGSGAVCSIYQLAQSLIELTGIPSEIRFEAFRAGEVRRSAADIRKASEALGYRPRYGLHDGLGEIWTGTSSVQMAI
jgi:UDP-glucose 4-epimerase